MLRRRSFSGMVLGMVTLVLLMVSVSPPAQSQVSAIITSANDITRGSTHDKSMTYTNSTIDTAWFDYEGTGFSVDSVQFAVATPDTARYRTALLFRNTIVTRDNATAGTFAMYGSYVLAAGATAPVDTLSSTTAALNGMFVQGWVMPGSRLVGLVVQFSAAGNHVGVARIAALKYQVFAKAFYRYKI